MAERGAVDHSREPLSGLVERVTFHSTETGFCVLRVKVRGHRDLVTVLGSAAEVHAGEHIQASGQWQQHREHGLQFRASSQPGNHKEIRFVSFGQLVAGNGRGAFVPQAA